LETLKQDGARLRAEQFKFGRGKLPVLDEFLRMPVLYLKAKLEEILDE
jgi:hypothetical protein